jgi:hypothetical protein
MTLETYIAKLKQTPKTIAFTETIAIIEENYTFIATAFQNGKQHNATAENSGSCKLFAFAKLQNLSQEEALACFGAYYFEDVLKNPEGNDHLNIRNFMKTGWNGIRFESEALTLKQ